MKLVIEMIICHLVGDYVLQSDYIATTKGDNWYHLLIHCALYTLPFMFLFGVVSWQIALIFTSHIIVDALKARYKKIGYAADQMLHYWIIMCVALI